MVNTPQGSGRVRQPRNHQEEHHAVEAPQLFWEVASSFETNRQTHKKQTIQSTIEVTCKRTPAFVSMSITFWMAMQAMLNQPFRC